MPTKPFVTKRGRILSIGKVVKGRAQLAGSSLVKKNSLVLPTDQLANQLVAERRLISLVRLQKYSGQPADKVVRVPGGPDAFIDAIRQSPGENRTTAIKKPLSPVNYSELKVGDVIKIKGQTFVVGGSAFFPTIDSGRTSNLLYLFKK